MFCVEIALVFCPIEGCSCYGPLFCMFGCVLCRETLSLVGFTKIPTADLCAAFVRSPFLGFLGGPSADLFVWIRACLPSRCNPRFRAYLLVCTRCRTVVSFCLCNPDALSESAVLWIRYLYGTSFLIFRRLQLLGNLGLGLGFG